MNKEKTPSFLLAADRLGLQDYIVYTRGPVVIARIENFSDEAVWKLAQADCRFCGTAVYKNKFILLRVLTEPDIHEAASDKLTKIMARMSDWYFSILKEKETHGKG